MRPVARQDVDAGADALTFDQPAASIASDRREPLDAFRPAQLQVLHLREAHARCRAKEFRVTQRATGFQTASASRIRFVIASGCEMSARWLASISIVFAPIRLAMKRSRSGLIVRSWVDTA